MQGDASDLRPDWIYSKRHKQPEERAFGDWIDKFADWQWFVTRTLGRPVDMGFTVAGAGVARHCLRDLLVRTEARTVACCFETQERGTYHLHALLAGCRGIDGGKEGLRDFEKWGISRWKAYKRGGGASSYLGKYLTKAEIELYISDKGPWNEKQLEGNKLSKLRC